MTAASVEQRDEDSDLGGTMRLGEQVCVLNQGCLAERVYGDRIVRERHRHRYEVNNRYLDRLTRMAWWLLASLRTANWSKWSSYGSSLVYRMSVPP